MSPAADRIIEACNDGIAEIAEHFFGPPKRRDRRGTWRWSGGIEVATAGRHAGRFIIWGATEAGDGIELIRFAARCEFPEALRWAAGFFGLPLDDAKPLSAGERRRIRAEAEQRRRQAEQHRAHDEDRRIGKARMLWESAT